MTTQEMNLARKLSKEFKKRAEIRRGLNAVEGVPAYEVANNYGMAEAYEEAAQFCEDIFNGVETL